MERPHFQSIQLEANNKDGPESDCLLDQVNNDCMYILIIELIS